MYYKSGATVIMLVIIVSSAVPNLSGTALGTLVLLLPINKINLMIKMTVWTLTYISYNVKMTVWTLTNMSYTVLYQHCLVISKVKCYFMNLERAFTAMITVTIIER